MRHQVSKNCQSYVVGRMADGSLDSRQVHGTRWLEHRGTARSACSALHEDVLRVSVLSRCVVQDEAPGQLAPRPFRLYFVSGAYSERVNRRSSLRGNVLATFCGIACHWATP